ncbi:hypothetical protein ACF082_34595 [Streptomyces lydicus]|uniref:hypothetical protein n=1 Tax=Streptomyces lydicus TaxID=47763 RepID=UPI0037015026
MADTVTIPTNTAPRCRPGHAAPRHMARLKRLACEGVLTLHDAPNRRFYTRKDDAR